MLKILLDESSISKSELDRLSSSDIAESLNALEQLFKNLNGGINSGTATLVVNKDIVASAGEIDLTGEVSVDDTVTINGVTFTAKAVPSGETQFAASATVATAKASLLAKINASTSAKLAYVTAVAGADGVIALNVDEGGALSLGYTLSKSGTNIDVTDFAAGTNGTAYSFTL
jgi:hypothetical protein